MSEPYAAPERRPSTALIAVGWVFTGLALLFPIAGIVGLVMGIILWAQGWPRHGAPIVAVSVLIMVLAGVLWYFYYYD
jgi:hypothetical protein